MKRLHVHVGVGDLDASVRFYSALFGSRPTVLKSDYAKWMLEDPRVNFAISNRCGAGQPGLRHLGVQAESTAELEELQSRLPRAGTATTAEPDATCCYARSDKHWAEDPAGITWELFHTKDSAAAFGEDTGPAARQPQRTACGCAA
jgi:catechol 2,3-dioxygenase-like lactoylglutathione lyase family enzyme